jgi:hypothetical protein
MIPYQATFTAAVGSAGATPFATRVANNTRGVFMIKGLGVDGENRFRVKWPNGRYLSQGPAGAAPFTDGVVFPRGTASAMLALNRAVTIMPDQRITIEMVPSVAGTLNLQFWGDLLYFIKDTGGASGVRGADACLVGYPTGSGGRGSMLPIELMPDPVAGLENLPRYFCGPNQNIMAPEFRLGNQCTRETPEGFEDESCTFFSKPIVCPVNDQVYGVEVIAPGSGDVIIRHFRGINTFDDGVSGIPLIGARLPSGYSVTGGDLVPALTLNWVPVFPNLKVGVKAGGRLILDVSNMNAAGSGNITTVVEFDAVKRRRKR